MLEVKIDPKSFGILEKNSKRFKKRLRVASNRGLHRAAVTLYYFVKENISRTDHTLDDLQDKDHPYATRHGRIKSGRLGGAFTKKPYMIHTRKGGLIDDLKFSLDRKTAVSSVYFDNGNAYTETIVKGTRTMPIIPRDVISGTANERKVQKAIYKDIKIQLKDVIKSYGSK